MVYNHIQSKFFLDIYDCQLKTGDYCKIAYKDNNANLREIER